MVEGLSVGLARDLENVGHRGRLEMVKRKTCTASDADGDEERKSGVAENLLGSRDFASAKFGRCRGATGTAQGTCTIVGMLPAARHGQGSTRNVRAAGDWVSDGVAGLARAVRVVSKIGRWMEL